jgi:PAS domain S-box-containing protein
LEDTTTTYPFLQGGGEMGQLIRSYNWESTPLGPIESWPLSLRTTVGIILKSAFPMLVFWGDDFTAIYNDAYREILQERHPVLGFKAKDIYPEGWDTVKPMLEKVYESGEPVAYEDMLIPVLRDGVLQNVYWSFSYSPAYGDDDSISGIFICCNETTGKIEVAKKLSETDLRLQTLIREATIGIIVLEGEDCITQVVNKAYASIIGRSPEDLLNKPLFDIIPETAAFYKPIIDRVRNTGEVYYLYDSPYRIFTDEETIEGYLNAVYQPYRNDEGAIEGVMVMCQDVTEQVMDRKKAEQSERRFANLVMEATVATAVLTGPDMVLELANEVMLSIWGRDASVIGKALLDFMPELKGQPFPKLLARIMETGETYVATDAPVYLEKNGKPETVYMDFSYKPLKSDSGKVNSILVMATDVTERTLVNKRIAQSEENLRNTILKAPVAMCIFRGPDHVVEIANNRILELWGKTADEVLHKPQFEGLPEARFQGFEEILDSVYTTGKSFAAQGVPVTLPRKHGLETVYVNFAFEPYIGPDGDTIGIIAVAIDVTEQVRSNNMLQESEQRVRAVIEAAPFPIGVYEGREMRIILVNQSIIDVWDKGSDIVGKTYFEVLPELADQDIYPKLLSVYDTGVPYRARNQRVDLVVDGELRSFYFNYDFTPLFDASGKVYGVMNTAADVTDLNVAKQKVEQSERNFRNMILQAPVAMCILLGPDHIVDIANEQMIALWGKPVEDIMHKPIFEGLPDAREQGLEQLLDSVYETGETFTANERPVELLRNGKLDVVYQNFVYEPYRDASGTILGVLAISIDVTAQVVARRKIEEVVKERTAELEHANTNLQRSNAELAQFAYIASHDLQEPIRKISIFAQMLGSRAHGLLDSTAENYLNKISSSAERMQALIRDVLTYSELVKENDLYSNVNLNDIVIGTITDYELLIEQKRAKVNYNYLPVIEAIPLQMSQLFGNLISNSLKYSRPGVDPVITITSDILKPEEAAAMGRPGQLLHKIEFEDNGIGFGQEYAEKIFNIFQRLHGKTEFTGTGIGLAICKKIVQNHHGFIMASSVEGQGAVFTIILPEIQQDTE